MHRSSHLVPRARSCTRSFTRYKDAQDGAMVQTQESGVRAEFANYCKINKGLLPDRAAFEIAKGSEKLHV